MGMGLRASLAGAGCGGNVCSVRHGQGWCASSCAAGPRRYNACAQWWADPRPRRAGAGVIGFQEFLLALSSLAQRAGRALSTERVQKMFSLADRDGNGVLDFGEFLILEQKKRAVC